MEDVDKRYTKNLGRNLIIGLATVYPATVGLCLVATGDLGASAAIATVPAVFAGPYVGLLITLIAAVSPNRTAQAVEPPRVVPVVTAAAVRAVTDAAA